MRRSKCFYFLCLDHLVFAALLAICFRFLAESFLARALPPFNPPVRPIRVKYSDREMVFCGGDSSIDSRTISAASWFGSFGSCLLERLMHSLSHSFAV